MPCIPLPGGGVMCTRGPRPRAPCSEDGCGKVHEYLCDGPAPRRKSHTCDRRLCAEHAKAVGGPGEDLHLCPSCAAAAAVQRSLF